MNSKTFFELNKNKFIPILLINLLVFGSLFLLFGALNYLNNTIESFQEVVLFALKIGIPLGVFIFFVIVFSSFQDEKIEHKLMTEEPLKHLETIGFEPIIINENTIWSFSKLVYGKRISYYPVHLSITKDEAETIITFSASSKRKKIGLVKSSAFQDELTKHDIMFSKSVLFKSYSANEILQIDIKEIEQKINEMIALMKFHNFEPLV